ncbi:SHOCT domain-containing protein [Kocuria turfanensis]|uniref:SHOCT domain-containing protein n=1 Tax=Kocuria turfanensis TaxID=388357 RepID=A0A512IFI7_9MICC|nr:SHOCT domain-containing protein [Kocuria turfanensis]GEO96427.1 hypothetical protein KTU01_25500 [Kocuria turfanensis]
MMNGGGMGGMGLMWLFGLLVLVGVVTLVVVLIKAFTGGSPNAGRSGAGREPGTGFGRGREILKERFARGEISTEEYHERLRTLEEDGR